MSTETEPLSAVRVEPVSGMLTDEQAAHIGRELVRHLKAGATIKAEGERCLEPLSDGSVYGGLVIVYPEA